MAQNNTISNLLGRGVSDVVVKKDLEKLLASGKKLKVYFGIDPTSPNIHLGNAVPLRKLRDFQEAGHQCILLVGSFTARIGDTSDKDAMRKSMDSAEIAKNFKTYKAQAAKILDIKKVKVLYNDKWLAKLSFTDVAKLASEFTVQQMIERDMFEKRLKEGKPIGLHEFLYPLMQGYDSVHMEVDVEIGGNDQLFNMLAGRTLLRTLKGKEKHVVTTPLIEGLDGRKMSKSYGNTVNITDEPADMYGKIMSLADGLIIKYFELCTDVPLDDIREIERGLAKGDNPRDAKARLASEIVALYHGEKAAHSAEEEFETVFRKGGQPEDVRIVLRATLTNPRSTSQVLVDAGLALSKSEARRLIEQGGVKKDGEKIDEDFGDSEGEIVVQVGKRKFVKIK